MQDYTLTGLYTLPIVSLSLTGWSLNLEKNEPVLDRFMDERALPWPFQPYRPWLTSWRLYLKMNEPFLDWLKSQPEVNEPFFDFFTNQPGDEWASPWLVENSTRRKMNLSLTALHWFKTLPKISGPVPDWFKTLPGDERACLQLILNLAIF